MIQRSPAISAAPLSIYLSLSFSLSLSPSLSLSHSFFRLLIYHVYLDTKKIQSKNIYRKRKNAATTVIAYEWV